jgi:hypothetical protein
VLETYKAGVDDCMTKPVSPSLFQAKVKVWLRRFGSVSSDEMNPLKVGTLQLFPTERMVMLKNGGVVQLTNLELRLLYYLMNRPGQIVTTEELNQRVWGYTAEADNTMLKNVVYRLRRKIEADPANPLMSPDRGRDAGVQAGLRSRARRLHGASPGLPSFLLDSSGGIWGDFPVQTVGEGSQSEQIPVTTPAGCFFLKLELSCCLHTANIPF